MGIKKKLYIILSISLFLSACTPYEYFECDVVCSIEDTKVDCECPDICYNLTSDYLYMRLNGVEVVSLGDTFKVDEGLATIGAATTATSAAYVNMYGPDSIRIGSITAYPRNYEELDSLQLVLDSGFVFPVEVSYYTIGSWWNSAYLTELSLCEKNESL